MSNVEGALAKRMTGVTESATLRLNAAVQALKAQGTEVINLSTGEPDFAVPDVVKQAVERALTENRSKYTPAPGIPELRAAIAAKTNAQQPGLARPWKGTDVVVTNGGKQALFNSMLALLNEGDEVLIPTPYWLSYPEMAKLAQAKPVFIETRAEEGFRLTASALSETLRAHPRAKLLLLNSPSNPTGAMLSQADLVEIGAVLAQYPRVWIMSDEIYDRITFGATAFCSFLAAVPELRDRTITVNGLSKSGAMTGWRLGWAVAPAPVLEALVTLQGQSTSGICALTQWAGVTALAQIETFAPAWQATYLARRDAALAILSKTGKLRVFRPEGAFYFFIDATGLMKGFAPSDGSGDPSAWLAEKILEKVRVAVVPGGPFGADHWIRISFATEEKALLEGCRRLVQFAEA